MILTYDVETTGLWRGNLPFDHPDQAKIVQIAAILDDEEGHEISRLNAIIWQENVPDQAAAIHGLTTTYVQTVGLNETNVLNVFADMVDVANIVVGHNHENFDNKIANASARRAFGVEDLFRGKKSFDTMVAGTPLCRLKMVSGGFKKPKLTELHRFLFNEDFDNAHSAMSDASATRRCFYKMQEINRGTVH